MSLVSENIRYLRKLNGLTQEQFSRKINIKRSLLGAYEEGRANPNQQNIQAIARVFNTTVELLTRQDLRKIRETPNLSIPLGNGSGNRPAETIIRPSTIRSDGRLDTDTDPFQHPDFPDIFAPTEAASAAKTPEPKPLSAVLSKFYKPDDPQPSRESRMSPPVITDPVRPTTDRVPAGVPAFQPVSTSSPVDRLFSSQPDVRPVSPAPAEPPVRRPPEPHPVPVVSAAIPLVMQGQFAEYAQRHQQGEFVNRLPAMNLPTLPEGHYRAFEAGDDFTFPGALLVGQLIRNWFDIADGRMYVLLVQGTGICCRRVYNQVKVKGSLLLTADRTDIPNREVPLKDVLEVWDIRAFVSQQLPAPTPSTDRLRQLVDELRFEVERLK